MSILINAAVIVTRCHLCGSLSYELWFVMVCLVFKRMIDMTCLTEAEEREKQHAEALKSSQADLVTSDFTLNALLLSARNTA